MHYSEGLQTALATKTFIMLILAKDPSTDIAIREHSLMTSHIRVGRGVQDSPKKGRYRVGQGR